MAKEQTSYIYVIYNLLRNVHRFVHVWSFERKYRTCWTNISHSTFHRQKKIVSVRIHRISCIVYSAYTYATWIFLTRCIPRDRWTIGKTVYISLTFYCLRVRYPTKRVLALERYKLRQGKAAIFLTLFARSEWSNNRNFQRFVTLEYLPLLWLLSI